jgi:hypothetical protein
LTVELILDILVSMKKKSTSGTSKGIFNAAQRLQFVVRFAQMDLETLRPGDWLNLQWELRDFLLPTHQDLLPGGLHVFPVDPPYPEDYSRQDFRTLQAETRAILEMVIDTREDNRGWRFTPIQIRFAAPQVPQPPDGKQGRHLLDAEGTTRDMFLLLLWALLGQSNTAPLLRCPECNTIFLRKRNQEYCSRACVNRVSQRRWRERHETAATP